LEAALPHIARTGLPLLTHAELAGPIEEARARLIESEASWDKYSTYLASRPDEAELTAIRLMIRLCRTYKSRVYIVHLSSAKALPELLEARAEGLPITVETCPHYLHFEAEQIPDCAVLYKCAPPIRGRANRLLLWDALESGIIDLIGTDHSPCLPHMKEGDFQTAWGGIASLSIALPVIWTEAKRRKIPITKIVEWMSQRPAQVAGIAHRKGSIAEGRDADLVVFDPDATTVVEPGSLRFRHPISPYMSETLQGSIDMTFVRGTRVYDHGQFPSSPDGREVTRR
jgi:allantoinase